VLDKKLATPEELVSGAKRYAAERAGQDGKYTKHPATWLNNECWADEPARPDVDAEDRTATDAPVAGEIITALTTLNRAELMGETCPPGALEQAQRALGAVTAAERARLEKTCRPETFAAVSRAIDELPGLIERARQSAPHASRLKDNQKISNPVRAESRSDAILRLVEPGLASTANRRQ
jgi:hypothetical protein